MDSAQSVPSIDQISFKLTQNLIPSATQLSHPPPSCDSLDYTHSKVSIMYILDQNQEPNVNQSIAQQPCSQKESTLKTTCEDMSGLSAFKKSKKASFRQRFISANKSVENPKINRRFSVHVMSLATPMFQKKDNLTLLHAPHPAPFRAKQQKKKSPGRQFLNCKKLVQCELLELQSSMKVRGVVLQNHEAREKSFIRKVIQNRSNIIHPIQQFTRAPQIWTSRRSFRIH